MVKNSESGCAGVVAGWYVREAEEEEDEEEEEEEEENEEEALVVHGRVHARCFMNEQRKRGRKSLGSRGALGKKDAPVGAIFLP